MPSKDFLYLASSLFRAFFILPPIHYSNIHVYNFPLLYHFPYVIMSVSKKSIYASSYVLA